MGGLPTSYPSAQESEAGGSQIQGQWEQDPISKQKQ